MQFPKPRPALLDKQAKRKQIQAEDEAENKLVRARSGGRCEVDVIGEGRCARRAAHVHHRVFGWRLRGRKDSALAENKIHACAICHTEIHGHVLKAEGRRFRRWA